LLLHVSPVENKVECANDTEEIRTTSYDSNQKQPQQQNKSKHTKKRQKNIQMQGIIGFLSNFEETVCQETNITMEKTVEVQMNEEQSVYPSDSLDDTNYEK